MTFTVCTDPQRSDAWFKARLGRVTGSRAADMLKMIKSGESAARRDYRIQLACERLTGISQDDTYINREMQRGIDLEPAAFAAYEAKIGALVRKTGFLSHNELMVGCSLDGDVGNFTGIVELKCPKSATHLEYIQGRKVPEEHAAQCRHNLWVSGAQWLDFCSYDDRFPLRLQLFKVRLYREQAGLDGYESQVLQFLGEVERQTTEIEFLPNE